MRFAKGSVIRCKGYHDSARSIKGAQVVAVVVDNVWMQVMWSSHTNEWTIGQEYSFLKNWDSIEKMKRDEANLWRLLSSA